MVERKKVCYTLEQKAIDKIDQLSGLKKRAKSKYLSDCIKYSCKKMMKEYCDMGSDNDVNNEKKSFNYDIKNRTSGTIPKTFILPINVIEDLNWFSEKLGMKKSHLVFCCILYAVEQKFVEPDISLREAIDYELIRYNQKEI